MAIILRGDVQGSVLWDTYWTFWGPNVHRLRGVEIISKSGGRYFEASELAAACEWSPADVNAYLVGHSIQVVPVAAGPAGTIVEPSSLPPAVFEIDFADGTSIVVLEEFPEMNRPFHIFRKHVEEHQLQRQPSAAEPSIIPSRE
ncbi:hypothetical protein QTL95_21635 [Rhizobium sp. S152]|uniref:hypothetical protein n=1 Tax=Rhizobium sp. S152 TaxID=3055038 RepID=UPI0025AA1419|nr:hypothetical protein [Rhizobium sp. S152]MDM9628503.1 hypothetical protein [Rhizobium sp. S152]